MDIKKEWDSNGNREAIEQIEASEKITISGKGMYSFEILTTTACNLSCTYCFEGHKPKDRGIVNTNKEKYFESIRAILKEKWFQDEYSGMLITFWGGEPTVNTTIIENVMEEFKNENIKFFIYGNGFNTKKYKKFIEGLSKEAIQKLQIQISYDGKFINDKYRLTNNSQTTSREVLETFYYLSQQPLDVLNFKQTLPINECWNMYETWLEFKNLDSYYKRTETVAKHVIIGYSPTVDSFGDIDDTYLEDFKKNIKAIAKDEIDYVRENGSHLMTWFNGGEQRSNCSTGSNMSIIDEDGSIYPCHGALYLDDKKEHKMGNWEDISGAMEWRTEYKKNINMVEDGCHGCVATTCMVCPTTVYGKSKKDDKTDRWNDRTANGMCAFYKFFGTVDRSLQDYLKKGV